VRSTALIPGLFVVSALLMSCVGDVTVPDGETLAFVPASNGPSSETPKDPMAFATVTGPNVLAFSCVRGKVHPLDATCAWKLLSSEPESLRCAISPGEAESPCALEGERTTRVDTRGPRTFTLEVKDARGQATASATVELGGGWEVLSFDAVPARGFRPFQTVLRWSVVGLESPVSCTLDYESDGTVDERLTDCGQGSAAHTFNVEGTFTSTLVVDDGAGTTVRRTTMLTVGPPPPDLAIDRTTWGQTAIGPVLRLVAGKPALLMAGLTSDTAGLATPVFRVRALVGTTELGSQVFTGPSTVPTSVPSDDTQLFRTLLPGAWLVAGVTLVLEVDPSNLLEEKSKTNNTLELKPTVGTGTVLPLTVVPVVHQGATAVIPDFEQSLLRVWPLKAIRTVRRAPYTYGGTLTGAGDAQWEQLLSEVAALRNTDGSADHYYGFVHVTYGSGIAGIGYVGRRGAVGRDDQIALTAMAHELGHNFGREHAPCGVSPSDANFPYTGGRVGRVGFDVFASAFKAVTLYDLMAYCNPTWISDYTYLGAQRFIEQNVVSPPSALQMPSAALHLFGRSGAHGEFLSPPLRVEGVPTPNEPEGRYHLEVVGSNRRAELSFNPDRLAEGDGEHFSLLVPDVGEVQSVRVWKNDRLVHQRALPAVRSASVRDGSPVEGLEENGTLSLRWDAVRYPVVTVSHIRGARRTTLGLSLTTGAARLPVSELPSDGHFEVTASDGMQSVTVGLPRR
jgi:hypothetical protein